MRAMFCLLLLALVVYTQASSISDFKFPKLLGENAFFGYGEYEAGLTA